MTLPYLRLYCTTAATSTSENIAKSIKLGRKLNAVCHKEDTELMKEMANEYFASELPVEGEVISNILRHCQVPWLVQIVC